MEVDDEKEDGISRHVKRALSLQTESLFESKVHAKINSEINGTPELKRPREYPISDMPIINQQPSQKTSEGKLVGSNVSLQQQHPIMKEALSILISMGFTRQLLMNKIAWHERTQGNCTILRKLRKELELVNLKIESQCLYVSIVQKGPKAVVYGDDQKWTRLFELEGKCQLLQTHINKMF